MSRCIAKKGHFAPDDQTAKRPHNNRQTDTGKKRADKEIVKHDHAHRDYAGRDYAGRDYAHACQGDRNR